MIKSRHIIRLVTILAALCLLFSISSFADDATPSNFCLLGASSSGPTWSNWDPGNNVWYDSNGIPYYQTFGDNETYYGINDLLGSPIFAPQAGAGRSTFYGTSNLNTSSNLLGGTREYLNDTFDSNFTADANGLTTSYASIHDSNFTSSKTASVTANNGTVMEMYDNNFNGNTTINAASGGTVNVTLGNSAEMQQLLSDTNSIKQHVSDIRSRILIIIDNIVFDRISTSSGVVSGSAGGVSYSYTMPSFNINGSTYYFNFRSMLKYYFNSLATHLFYNYGETTTRDTPANKIITLDGYPVIIGRYSWNRFSYDPDNDIVNFEQVYRYSTFNTQLYYGLYTIVEFFRSYTAYIADTWYRWYNPRISGTNNYFWYAYNTDTGEYDPINLAGLMQYVTWYLGKLYDDSTNVTETMHQMTEDIGTAATTFQDLNQKEQTAIDQISQGFETFLPDVNQFSSFKAITWCSNYLQQIYLSLGSYGTVIFIALLFGVCLQFIGYFRYK